MMAMNLSSSYAYGNPVYLTNMATISSGPASVTASFSIAGGTNFVPYDILTTTNLINPIASWNWIGIGYTSNRYTFSNQPAGNAFYKLAKPSKTMTVGFGDDSVAQCDVPFALTNVLQVAGGAAHSLALKNDGTVVAWGWNPYGQTTVPTNLTGVAMVAAGWYHSVALLTNGTVITWGISDSPLFGGLDITNVPPNLTNAIVISAQALHSLALMSNGIVVAWGYNTIFNEATVPAGLSNVVAISAGYIHNLVAKSDGTVVAWGYNGYGRCNVPAGLSNVVDVAAGLYHSLALKKDGTVVAWGDNALGEATVPAGLSNVVAIAASGDADFVSPYTAYSLALKNDGTVVVWGDDDAVDPIQGLSNVISIAAGGDHALAVRTGPATPVITLEPIAEYQVAGSNVTFTARGAGLYGVTYQWQTNGVNLSGATNATLTLTNVQPPAQLASYDVLVGNELGSIVSSNANFYFVTPPVILSESPLPTNQIVIYLTNVTLSVVATAPGIYNGFPLSYQWQLNGTNIAGANSASYTFQANQNSSGAYSVLVSNAAGSTNAIWQVTVIGSHLQFIQQPTNQYQIAGGSISFISSGISSNAISYQWQFNTTNIVGATNAVLTLTNVQAAQQGIYDVVINDSVNSLTSSNANFYLVTPPVFTSQSTPTNLVCIYGNYISFAATATAPFQTNGFPLHYQWQFNGMNISGATTTNYAFTANDNSSGIYSLIVTNIAGSTNANWQVTVTNVINVTNDLLLIYNSNSSDSSNLCAYYLAHRPMVGGANVLGVACDVGEFTTSTNCDAQIVAPVLNWLTNNPAKRPQYVVLFYDIPTRLTNSFPYPVYGSVSYHLQNVYLNWKPFVNNINAGSLADCEAYVDKLAYIGTNFSPGKLIISASAGGYGNTNYYFDDTESGYGGDPVGMPAVQAVIQNGASSNSVAYVNANPDCGSLACHLTSGTNVAGYFCWGAHSSLGGGYPVDGAVQWSGNSGWWIIETIESFNGQRSTSQGNFIEWFSSNAFGGTNYSNTPVGAVSHTEEPGSPGNCENSAIYFGLWASEKDFAICAWNARNTPYFQAVGDPLVTK